MKESFISIFSPNRTKPEHLKQIHIERDDLLHDAFSRVKKSILGRKRKHLLFHGARGTGKTHLMSLLVHEVVSDSSLDGKVDIAWLNEDETSLSYVDLLVRIFSALNKRYSSKYLIEDLNEAFELGLDGAKIFLEKKLLKISKLRKILVIIENMDALLGSIGEKGQREWRAFLQDHSTMIVVATAQRMKGGDTKLSSKKNNPNQRILGEDDTFYGFFTVTALKPFSVDEARKLLSKLADFKDDKELVEFIATKQGKARIRAIHHISGGNPRLYMILSDFITKESLDDLVPPFERMIDEQLTPYYQERLRWLSDHQRKIVETMCSHQGGITVVELAKKIFITENSLSSQLKKLKEMGYVESIKNKRESYYNLKEPLMRISLQVKESRDAQPLAIIIEFLKVWFERDEMEALLTKVDLGEVSKNYFSFALNQIEKEEIPFREKILREIIGDMSINECGANEIEAIYELADETKKYGDLLFAATVANRKNNYIKALEFVSDCLDIDKLNANNEYQSVITHMLAIATFLKTPEKEYDLIRKFLSKHPFIIITIITLTVARIDNNILHIDNLKNCLKLIDEPDQVILALVTSLSVIENRIDLKDLREWSIWLIDGLLPSKLNYKQELGLRLFNAGIDYLCTTDQSHILQLPKEERMILETVFDEKIEKS